jgi:hypothetical protein
MSPRAEERDVPDQKRNSYLKKFNTNHTVDKLDPLSPTRFTTKKGSMMSDFPPTRELSIESVAEDTEFMPINKILGTEVRVGLNNSNS